MLKARGVQRLDVVFDIYKSDSLKSHTREIRAVGVGAFRVSVRGNTPFNSKNFESFMRNDSNKTELFVMLANSFSQIDGPVIVTTRLNDVVSNQPHFDKTPVAPCNHEEADT